MKLTLNRDKDLYLNDEQYKAALERFLMEIKLGASGEGRCKELWFYDSTVVGDKNTECSWGLCNQDERMWPPDAMMFPHVVDGAIVGDEDRKIVSVKYLGDEHHCPFDRRIGTSDKETMGCFYHCRVFNPKRGIQRPNRDSAIKLYQVALDRLIK